MYQNCPKIKGEYQKESYHGYDAILRGKRLMIYEDENIVYQSVFKFKMPLIDLLRNYVDKYIPDVKAVMK